MISFLYKKEDALKEKSKPTITIVFLILYSLAVLSCDHIGFRLVVTMLCIGYRPAPPPLNNLFRESIDNGSAAAPGEWPYFRASPSNSHPCCYECVERENWRCCFQVVTPLCFCSPLSLQTKKWVNFLPLLELMKSIFLF